MTADFVNKKDSRVYSEDIQKQFTKNLTPDCDDAGKAGRGVESVRVKPCIPREFTDHDTTARLANLKTSNKVDPFTRAHATEDFTYLSPHSPQKERPHPT